MADIRPFQAYRPAAGLESEIAALPYDVYNREEAAEEVKKHPGSFLAIDRAETQFAPEVDTYADCVYEKAHDLLWQWIREGRFVREDKPCYYIYEQVMEGRSQKGIVACASIDDYQNQVIKKHENTRADKEQDRIRHVDVCEAQTGPIFLAYRSQAPLRQVIDRVTAGEALYDFTAPDGITHRVWVVWEEEQMGIIRDTFAGMEQIYIADGHHRCASAVKVGLRRRENNSAHTGEEEYNFFLSVLFSAEELKILDYNRVVKDLNGYEKDAFLEKIGEKFSVECLGEKSYRPRKKYEYGMYLEGEWYRLTAHEDIRSKDAVEGLDVSILQDHLLAPVLGIGDPKTDRRIDFVGGIRGLEELERRVRTDMQVAFALYPTSIYELFDVADAGRLMPPKSTWFEPKLRSGLFIHTL
ncbi:hypothetical protein IMSAGC003_03540 [Lachnospiraceae bacterium]|nr:DUF1015 family protein [Acetatifactor sp.]GFH96973.1 hypothetical protein IMSAGC003_03540 [Lachnospiraceae bacterium]